MRYVEPALRLRPRVLLLLPVLGTDVLPHSPRLLPCFPRGRAGDLLQIVGHWGNLAGLGRCDGWRKRRLNSRLPQLLARALPCVGVALVYGIGKPSVLTLGP